MGAQPEALTGRLDLDGGDLILSGVFIAGGIFSLVLVGVLGWCTRSTPSESRGDCQALARWERLAKKVINFARRRRRVSVAFANYSNHKLRRAAPKRAPRRRVSTPSRQVLSEGPAIRHGPNGR